MISESGGFSGNDRGRASADNKRVICYVELTAQQERVIFFSLLLYLTHNRLGELIKTGEESAAA